MVVMVQELERAKANAHEWVVDGAPFERYTNESRSNITIEIEYKNISFMSHVTFLLTSPKLLPAFSKK